MDLNRRFKIIALGIALSLLALMAGVGAAFYCSMPDYSGTASMPGLSAPVRIIRDEYGVPHIFADTMNDAAHALGYVHAGERLFQMEMQRRAGQGRLSEIIGPDMLGVDKYIRTLGLYGLAQSSFASMSPEAQKFFQAYADGVNEWLETHRRALPPEFFVLGIKPEPWKPADSVVWGKLMALELSKNYKLEILRAELRKKLTPDQMNAVFQSQSPDAPVTTEPKNQEPKIGQVRSNPPPLAGGVRGGGVTLDLKVQDKNQTSGTLNAPPPSLPREGGGIPPVLFVTSDPIISAQEKLAHITGLNHPASNEWVISGSRTASGKPILANDPHLGLEAPVLWYLARIVTPGFTIKGATVPGLPIVLLGQNDHIAWGFTTTGSDVQDLFVETVDPKNPGHYLTPEGSKAFETRTETIHVKGAPDVTLNTRATRHGPVMSDIDPEMAALAGANKVMALAFTALGAHDTTSEALMHLDRAQNWNEFLAALRLYQAPPQNVVYADTGGHIGFINPGFVPIRKKGNGTLPADGASGDYDWTGTISFAQWPQIYDPKPGFVFNANNAIAGPTYPYFMGVDWEEPYRAERIQQFFDMTKRHTLDSSAMMQADHVSLAALELLPYLLAQKPADARAATAIGLLRNWEGTMDKNRPEPLIFEAWLYEMHQLLLVAKTGSPLEEKGPYDAAAIDFILAHDAKDWCTDPQCKDIIPKALDAALALLDKRDGDDMLKWRWGDEHVTWLRHKFYSHIPMLSSLSRLDVASSGSYYTLDRGGSAKIDPEHPFVRTHGGGFRGIYDLGNPAQSRFMITTGESGHIFSPHYGDLVPLWNDVESFTLSGTRDELVKQGLPEFVLTPR